MGNYYYPNGDPMTSIGEFVDFYSQVYYYENRDKDLEDKIDSILKKDTLDEDDIIDILRWKIGATSYSRENKTVNSRWGAIDAKRIIADINGNKDKAQDVNFFSYDGIGSVYAVTLKYFVTKGECPIYDQFAKVALDAICDGVKPGGNVNYHELPGKESPEKVLEKVDEYKRQIVKTLNIEYNDYKNERKYDQALWAYGHLYNRV